MRRVVFDQSLKLNLKFQKKIEKRETKPLPLSILAEGLRSLLPFGPEPSRGPTSPSPPIPEHRSPVAQLAAQQEAHAACFPLLSPFGPFLSLYLIVRPLRHLSQKAGPASTRGPCQPCERSVPSPLIPDMTRGTRALSRSQLGPARQWCIPFFYLEMWSSRTQGNTANHDFLGFPSHLIN